MSAWSEMERVALLGTRRERLHLPDIAPDIDEVLAKIAGDDASRELLSTAGTLDLYEQIGRLPARQSPETFPLPREDRRACSSLAASYLAQMLGGSLRNLMPEFLGALAGAGMRIPETLLPNVLALGQKNTKFRSYILPVLGNRGRWLAARHQSWRYAALDPASWTSIRQTWEETADVQKPALVAQLRELDPALGRALVESTWRAENDNRRLRLIKQIVIGLSIEDEPLLETALDDRSHLVRRQAAEWLAQLPGSRLCARMLTYAPLYLSWTPDQTRKITISLPHVSPAMRRDGIVGANSKVQARVRSREIIQLVSAIPLDYWTAAWETDPVTLLRAIPTTAWPRTLTTAFSIAAVRRQDAGWARLILDECGITPVTARLIAVLSPDDLNIITRRALVDENAGQLSKDSDLITIIRRWTGVWESEIALQLLLSFARYFKETAGARVAINTHREVFLRLGRQTNPGIAAEAANLLGDPNELGCWRNTAVEFLRILRFRRDMLAALRQ